jgi:uncharacterized oligopeptide transporter (OPT) family protein
MTAQASAGIGLHAADLLTDLKSGYLLGAKPRHQFIAQFFGVIAGSLAVVPVFMLLVPDASAFGDDLPAPSGQQWSAVAKLLAQGVESLHWTARWMIVLGGAGGIVLVLLERALPAAYRRFVPSPMGFGLAWTIGAWNSISMALGALIAFAIEKRYPKTAGLLVVAVASGLIAGESLLGVFINIIGVLT